MARPRPLSEDEIAQELRSLPGWSGDTHGLKRRLKFKDFRGAIRFMQACVDGIDRLDHHPTWTNTYDQIDIHLDTHDAGHLVTANDVALARHLESVLAQTAEK